MEHSTGMTYPFQKAPRRLYFSLLANLNKLLVYASSSYFSTMMSLFSQAGSHITRAVKPRPSLEDESKPPSDTEPDDTSILSVPLSPSSCSTSINLTTNSETKMKALSSAPSYLSFGACVFFRQVRMPL
jgi:hypothetical protein